MRMSVTDHTIGIAEAQRHAITPSDDQAAEANSLHEIAVSRTVEHHAGLLLDPDPLELPEQLRSDRESEPCPASQPQLYAAIRCGVSQPPRLESTRRGRQRFS